MCVTFNQVGIPVKSDQPGNLIEAKFQAIESNSVRLYSDQLFTFNKPPNVHKLSADIEN